MSHVLPWNSRLSWMGAASDQCSQRPAAGVGWGWGWAAGRGVKLKGGRADEGLVVAVCVVGAGAETVS